MKTNLILAILVSITFHSFGQINFESGYFIDNNNLRVECLIKNMDWKNNPVEFDYKITAESESQKVNINSVKEFGITGSCRYVRADTKIDISSNDLNNLSINRNPEWSNMRLILKVLVEGKATLYYYEKGSLKRYFYSVSDSSVNQLVYKKYYANINQVAENFDFREQLWNNVRCANTSKNSVETIHFERSELERYFKKYNEGEGNLAVVYGEKKEKGDSFRLRITPGINYSSTSVLYTGWHDPPITFDSQTKLRIGIESEYIMPFNKNKWSIVFEPTYQYFNSSKKTNYTYATINYKSVEFPIGIRHYFFLNNDLKIFINVFFVPEHCVDFHSTVEYAQSTLYTKSGISFAFGGGIGYKIVSAETRYYTQRDLLADNLYFTSDYHRLSVILGLRIL